MKKRNKNRRMWWVRFLDPHYKWTGENSKSINNYKMIIDVVSEKELYGSFSLDNKIKFSYIGGYLDKMSRKIYRLEIDPYPPPGHTNEEWFKEKGFIGDKNQLKLIDINFNSLP